MIKPFLKEFSVPELAAGTQTIIKKGEVKLSESSFTQFIPFMSASVLNKSTEEIKIFINETDDNAFRVPANSSRDITGVPIWNISVQNMGTNTISSGSVFVTLINDVEQVARYNAYERGQR